MSKNAINKEERFEIISGLVIDATKKTGNTLLKQLSDLRDETRQAILNNFKAHVPELDNERIAELLQVQALRPASVASFTVYCDKERKSRQTMFEHSVGRKKMPDSRKDMQTTLMRRAKNSWAGNCLNMSTGSFYIELSLDGKFPDVPSGFENGSVVHPDDPNPQMNMHLNNFLHSMHFQVRTVLGEAQDLLDSAWEMYETIEAHLAPVKKVSELLKLMPEAEKHLPQSLLTESKTKEVADPTAINDIRTKLAAGLPV